MSFLELVIKFYTENSSLHTFLYNLAFPGIIHSQKASDSSCFLAEASLRISFSGREP